MLSHLIRRCSFLTPAPIGLALPAAPFSTTAKIIAEKKKKIYESQSKIAKPSPTPELINTE
jgi:hypothetical protein